MIEQGFYDLSAMATHRRRVIAFTRVDDPRWSGIVELEAGDLFVARRNERTDIFVLYGALAHSTGRVTPEDGFLSLQAECTFASDERGAVLFVYREPGDAQDTVTEVRIEQREWRAARVAEMRVADLRKGNYQLSLVDWGPGAQVRSHAHPKGEEIFVLDGELLSGEQRLPAGTWTRLHTGAAHAPRCEHSALILLRNGHLPTRQ